MEIKPLKFTTEVSIVPNGLPFKFADAQEKYKIKP